MNKKSKLLIVGKQPPPIGGVTVHVKRLKEALSYADNIQFSFYDLNKFNFFKFLRLIRKFKLIHLHSSSPFFRLGIAVVCILYNRKLITTIHGSLGRFSLLKNIFDYLAIIFTHYPVTVNPSSQNVALRLNSKSQLVSPFIPPYKSESLKKDLKKKILELRNSRELIFCTNAFNVSWDKKGVEIYGISELVLIFAELPKFGLICSDPSGNYSSYLKKVGIEIPNNVLFIPEPHDFIEIIKLSDTLLRTTTTDGDSLSIKEALYLNKQVIASDCTKRPCNVMLYETGNKDSLITIIKSFQIRPFKANIRNGFDDLEKLYNIILSKL